MSAVTPRMRSADLIAAQIPRFFGQVDPDQIYNEFSLQHELGYFLRKQLKRDLSVALKIEFERPVTWQRFNLPRRRYLKKEIDICVYSTDMSARFAVELKFPRNGQYPEQMFAACCDIVFLEELVAAGFTAGLFLMLVDDSKFMSGRHVTGIYSHFRSGQPITGTIIKPTGARDQRIRMRWTYSIAWQPVAENRHYCMIIVRPPRSDPSFPTRRLANGAPAQNKGLR